MSEEGEVKPTPIPIRLIQEPKAIDAPLPDRLKPNDNFYHAWDSFLSKSSQRGSSKSALAQRVARTRQAASKDEDGVSVQENSATSYEHAKAECQAKVRAIVAECKRLNQKYYDRHFDLECFQYDCLFPLDYPKSEVMLSSVLKICLMTRTSTIMARPTMWSRANWEIVGFLQA